MTLEAIFISALFFTHLAIPIMLKMDDVFLVVESLKEGEEL
jgi:hypothetical protein